MASETDKPMACSASVARAFVSLSIRARTTVSARIDPPQSRSSTVATNGTPVKEMSVLSTHACSRYFDPWILIMQSRSKTHRTR